MGILTRRLLRSINQTRGQFIALSAIVMLGVLIYISMSTAFNNLASSQAAFYQKTRFADHFFQVAKAPRQVVQQIEKLPGIAKASGSIVDEVAVLKPENKRAAARIYSYQLLEDELNQIYLFSGRNFENATTNEVIVDPAFAKANNLNLGNTLTIAALGKIHFLSVIGTASSPEFIYPMQDAASVFPDPQDFGIFMLPYGQAEQLFNMQGQVNQIAIEFAPGSNQEEVINIIKEMLVPYGLISNYPRKDQLSHSLLQGELDQLKLASRYLPLMFFIIAAGIQFILLNRLIKTQRLQIGIMKALGLTNLKIVLHYTSYALSVVLTGSIPGIIIGVLLASAFSDIYALFFHLPKNIGGFNGIVIFYSLFLTISIGFLSGILASRQIMKIAPAESMRPEPPKAGGKIWLENFPFIWRNLSSAWKMTFRAVSRNKGRFGVAVLGIASSVMVMMLALFLNDSINFILERYFHQEKKYDYIINFSEYIKESDISYWSSWEEILKMEPVLEIAVKINIKDDAHQINNSEDDLLQGLKYLGGIKEAFDEKGNPLQLPEDGILLSKKTAEKLGLGVGDMIQAKTRLGQGAIRKIELKVMGINEQLFGGASLVSLQTANHLLGQNQVISSVMLKVDPARDRISERLHNVPSVTSIISKTKEKANVMSLMDSMIYFIAVMIFFAAVLSMAIVYNGSIMTLNERRRELASLRVMGFSYQETIRLLGKESIMQTIGGIALGLPGGRILGEAYIASISSDLYSFPAVIYPQTYLISASAALLFVAAGFYLAGKRFKKIDITEAIINKD